MLVVVGALVVRAAAGALWWRWLTRRQGVWRVRLSDRIPARLGTLHQPADGRP